MKQKILKITVHVFVLLSLWTTLFSFQLVTPARAAAGTVAEPISQLINTDGTVNLSSGYKGNLDIKNYGVVLDPLRGPVLKPLMTRGVWSALGGTPLTSEVAAILVNGSDVYVGGDFLDAGGNLNADYIAKWNGTAWSALGNGVLGNAALNNQVFSIKIIGANIYAAGAFTDAGTDTNADYIAKWNGSVWSALGNAPLDNAVYTTAVSGTDLYVGGAFLNVAGDPNADFIAKWDGTAWSTLGTTPLDNGVFTIAVSGANIYVGGTFTAAGGVTGADRIAKWDGSAWFALGSGLNDTVQAIAVSGTDVYAGGIFLDAGGDANADHIAKWDGSVWSALGSGLNDVVFAITTNGTDIYAGGDFTDAGGDVRADKVARWNGTSWDRLGAGLNDTVEVILVNGADVYAGGTFTDASGNAAADKVAKFQPDLVAPTPVSITRTDADSTAYVSIHFTVTFSEAVTGVDATDFTLVTTGVVGASITDVSGSAAVYTVTVNTGTGNGTIRLDLLNDGTIQDIAENLLVGTLSSGEVYSILKTRTFNSVGSQDGFVTEINEPSGLGGVFDVNSKTFNVGDSTIKQQYRGILSFSTGAIIPDTAVITAVTLKVKKSAIVGGGNPVTILQGFMVDIKKGFFGTIALQGADFNATANKVYGPFKPTLKSGWYSITLTPAKAYINVLSLNSGLTQIRLRFKLDDNNNGTANYLKLFSGNAPLTSRPQLIISYYVP